MLAVLSPFALFALSVVALRIVGQPWPDLGQLAAQFGNPSWLLGTFLAAVVYGLGEEPGWRGFTLPRLQQSWNALTACGILTVFWAGWHTPFFAYRYHLAPVALVFFVLGLLAGSIVLAWLYNGTSGSVLMVMLWHTTWNAVNMLAAAISNVTVSNALVAMLTMEVIVAALVIVLVYKPATLAPAARHTLDDELLATEEAPATARPVAAV